MLLLKWEKKLFKKLKKSLSAMYDKPLSPPTQKERELVEELKNCFRNFQIPKTENPTASEREWLKNVNNLKKLILNDNPREFLRWHVISATMFAKYADYIYPELNYLKNQPNWIGYWSKIIKESPVGHPIPYWRYPHSSGNLIHHAYHLAKFEEKTGMKISAVNSIFEFGGGYGSMCRLIHNAGFSGRYIIFDFPAFSALQEYYLKSIGVKVCSMKSLKKEVGGVVCISDLEYLKEILSNDLKVDNSIFIATWSISEVPIKLRDMILPMTSSFGAFLIAYQDQFKEIDNTNFFRNWKHTYKDIEWHGWEIEHMPQNKYLIGKRKTF